MGKREWEGCVVGGEVRLGQRVGSGEVRYASTRFVFGKHECVCWCHEALLAQRVGSLGIVPKHALNKAAVL